MPTFDDTDELIDWIEHRFSGYGGVQTYEEQDDGTVIVAVTDTAFDLKNYSDDAETQKIAEEAVEDGDVFGVIHFDRKGREIDSLWGMVGYGGEKKALQAYKADYYTPGAVSPTQHAGPVTASGRPIRLSDQPTAVPTPTPPPVHLSRPGEELSRDEDRFIGWMLQQGWYEKRSDAIAHIERMRRSGTRIPGDLQGFGRPSLWHWPGLGR